MYISNLYTPKYILYVKNICLTIMLHKTYYSYFETYKTYKNTNYQ